MAETDPDPCTEEAIEQGCTCCVPTATAYDLDPPEPRKDKHCPMHGWAPDPDDARDRARDDAMMDKEYGDERLRGNHANA